MNLKKVTHFIVIAAALNVAAAHAQIQRFHANIRGGENKCTFEVPVDGIAEVEIQGESGVLRTIQGGAAQWIRLDCGSRLPNNPSDFRFKGVDGRGSQSLVRDPRGSGGVAVIRIEDPKDGSDAFTGDIF